MDKCLTDPRRCDTSTMERIDPRPSRAHKRASLIKAVASALVAGLVSFVVMFLLFQLHVATSGYIAAGVAVVTAGIVSAVTLPTPVRER